MSHGRSTVDAAAGGVDPITLEVQWQRLIAIADEMDTATIRTSFSTIVGESHDFGCVLMDQRRRRHRAGSMEPAAILHDAADHDPAHAAEVPARTAAAGATS